jgi:hypothetical protein
MTSRLARGLEFTHATRLDPTWTPAPGQKYKDGPHQRMVVTRVTRVSVFFRPVDGGAPAVLDRDKFIARYLPEETPDA